MSFTDKFIHVAALFAPRERATNQQYSTGFGSVEYPFSATSDWAENAARDRAEEAQRISVPMHWWREQLDKLADTHAAAISNALNDANLSISALKELQNEGDQKLLLGYALLLQQGDTRWGTSTTDTVLRRLGYSTLSFRQDVRRAALR